MHLTTHVLTMTRGKCKDFSRKCFIKAMNRGHVSACLKRLLQKCKQQFHFNSAGKWVKFDKRG